MKKIRIISLVLAAVILSLSLCACGGSSNKFDFALEDIKTKASELDFADAEFVLSTDEYAEDTLLFQYGIDSEELISQMEGYLLTLPGTNSSKTLVVFTFKEGTTTETFDEVEKILKEVYIANIINRTGLYDPTQADIANKATFTRYDNALTLVIYDTEGNTAVTDALFTK